VRHAVLVDPANFYSGIVVDAYARLKSTSFDADRYRDFVAAHGEPALEVGCGDGQPLLNLCAEGLKVEGVDSSADMLQRCRGNALRRGIEVRLHHERVEDLNLGRRYPSIYFAGPTFTLLPDDRTARRALEAIRRHLADDGMALIPLWVPAPTPVEELGVCRSDDDGLGVEVRYTPLSEKTDPVSRTRVTSTRYERITATDRQVAEREWIIHWQTPASFRRACHESGLDIVELIDDETGSAVTDDSTEFTATVCRGPDR
jgi:SAM-dependent methyltransferase